MRPSLCIRTKSEHRSLEKLVSDALIELPLQDELLQKDILWRVRVYNQTISQTTVYVNGLSKYQQSN